MRKKFWFYYFNIEKYLLIYSLIIFYFIDSIAFYFFNFKNEYLIVVNKILLDFILLFVFGVII